MDKENLLKWMAKQPEKTQNKIIEKQLEMLRQNQKIMIEIKAENGGEKEDHSVVEIMLRELIKAIEYHYQVVHKINPETGRKIDDIKDGKYYAEFKKIYADKFKTIGKKGAEKRRQVENLSDDITDFLALGVSYAGIVKMLMKDYKIKVSKSLIGKIILENEWDKIVVEKRIKMEEQVKKKETESVIVT